MIFRWRGKEHLRKKHSIQLKTGFYKGPFRLSQNSRSQSKRRAVARDSRSFRTQEMMNSLQISFNQKKKRFCPKISLSGLLISTYLVEETPLPSAQLDFKKNCGSTYSAIYSRWQRVSVHAEIHLYSVYLYKSINTMIHLRWRHVILSGTEFLSWLLVVRRITVGQIITVAAACWHVKAGTRVFVAWRWSHFRDLVLSEKNVERKN